MAPTHETTRPGMVKSWLPSVLIIAVTLFLLVRQVIDFSPLFLGPLRIENEFLSVNEKTILNDRVVDNIEYIEQNRLGGSLVIDPSRRSDIPKASVEPNEEFLEYVDNHQGTLFFDPISGSLYVNRPVEAPMKAELRSLFAEGSQELMSLDNLFIEADRYFTVQYSAEGREFLEKNNSLYIKFMHRWVLHHHAHLFFPIQRTDLTGDLLDLRNQYGFLMTMALYGILKAGGEVTFDSYYRVSMVFFVVYVFLVSLGVFILFFRSREWHYSLLAMAIAITSNYMLGFIPIHLAPGFNPLRHLPDFLIVVSVFLQFREKKTRYFFVTSVLILFYIFWNTEYGYAAFLANLTAVIFYVLFRRRALAKVTSLASIVSALAPLLGVLLLPSGNQDSSMLNILLGITAPTTYRWQILNVVVFFAITAIPLFLKMKTGDREYPFFYLFLWITASISCLYFIWNSLPHHFWTFVNSNIPFIVVFFSYAIDFLNRISHRPRYLSRWITLAAVSVITLNFHIFPNNPLVNLLGAHAWKNNFRIEFDAFDKSFERHVITEASYPRATFDTPMEMGAFEKDLAMIERHSAGEKRIVLLSTYDPIIPLLSDRYNDVPYITLPLNLVSESHRASLLKSMQTKRPRIIYADKDLHESDIFETVNPVDPVIGWIRGTAHHRLTTYMEFKETVKAILGSYEKIDDGNLLSAYRLIDGPGE